MACGGMVFKKIVGGWFSVLLVLFVFVSTFDENGKFRLEIYAFVLCVARGVIIFIKIFKY